MIQTRAIGQGLEALGVRSPAGRDRLVAYAGLAVAGGLDPTAAFRAAFR